MAVQPLADYRVVEFYKFKQFYNAIIRDNLKMNRVERDAIVRAVDKKTDIYSPRPHAAVKLRRDQHWLA